MEGEVSPSLKGLRKVTGVLFDMIEKGNRKHAFLSGYLKAKAKGLDEEAAIKEGIKVVHKTQFRYGKLGTPKVLRDPYGRVILQFTSYPIKQAQFLYDLYKKDPIAFIRYLGYAIGGSMALEDLLNIDMSSALGIGINLAEALEMVKSAAEGDMRGAWRHTKQAYQPGGGLLPSGLGPFPTSIGKITEAMREGKGLQQLGEEITPVIGSRMAQAYRAIKKRKTEVSNI